MSSGSPKKRGKTLVRAATLASICIEVDNPDVHFEKDIEYDLHAQIQNGAVLVIGKVRTPATLRCSRCLKVFRQPLQVSQFVYHKELAGEDFVDLTENLREDIILELPQRALCRPDCKGLCPVCGRDLNEGPCQVRAGGAR